MNYNVDDGQQLMKQHRLPTRNYTEVAELMDDRGGEWITGSKSKRLEQDGGCKKTVRGEHRQEITDSGGEWMTRNTSHQTSREK